MTAKQQLRKRWPLATCFKDGRRFMIYASPMGYISFGPGGFSARQAWEAALK